MQSNNYPLNYFMHKRNITGSNGYGARDEPDGTEPGISQGKGTSKPFIHENQRKFDVFLSCILSPQKTIKNIAVYVPTRFVHSNEESCVPP